MHKYFFKIMITRSAILLLILKAIRQQMKEYSNQVYKEVE